MADGRILTQVDLISHSNRPITYRLAAFTGECVALDKPEEAQLELVFNGGAVANEDDAEIVAGGGHEPYGHVDHDEVQALIIPRLTKPQLALEEHLL